MNTTSKSITELLQQVTKKTEGKAGDLINVNGAAAAPLPSVTRPLSSTGITPSRFHDQPQLKRLPPSPGQFTTRLNAAKNRLTQRAIPSVFDFGKDSTEISIYIDEAWPQKNHNDPNKGQEGVIAGMVWIGAPNYSILPHIHTHLAQDGLLLSAYEALNRIFDHPDRCFPFIMPIDVGDARVSADGLYNELIRQSLKLLLGWLLPAQGVTATVHVYLERYGGHQQGDDATAFISGFLSASPSRFQRWRLKRVEWQDKDFEYIPYADLLAYVPQEHGRRCAELGRLVNYRTLPGYVPLNMELTSRLERLEHIECIENMDDLLTFFIDTEGTALAVSVLKDMERRFQEKPELKKRLIAALENRYRQKERDLPRLRELFRKVHTLVGALPEDAGLQTRLLWFAVALQDANHDGDPDRVAAETDRYAVMRDKAIQNDQELVSHVDLHLAVHYADRFEFRKASRIIEDLFTDSRFPFFSLQTQGRILSSRGQYHSLQSDYQGAEVCFAEALTLFDRAELTPSFRATEKDQTGVYRAINAVDGALDNARELVEAVIGPVKEAAAHLATDASVGSIYRHHLLVRTLFMRKDWIEERQAYLDLRSAWSRGWPQDPWQLIHFYRGLLLFETDDHQDHAGDWFAEAFAITDAAAHGDTLKLIGAMMATVVYCCCSEKEYMDLAIKNLDMAAGLPAASLTIAGLREILENPNPMAVHKALGLLPFNYH